MVFGLFKNLELSRTLDWRLGLLDSGFMFDIGLWLQLIF